MPRVPKLVVHCVAAATISLIAFAAAPAAASASPEQRLLSQINSYRAGHGLKPLRFSHSLSRSSRRFARSQMRRDHFGHAARIRASRAFRALGEVMALRRGWRLRTAPVMRQWRRSAAHRYVLLSTGFREVGLGRSRGRFGRRRATIWVVQVGRR